MKKLLKEYRNLVVVIILVIVITFITGFSQKRASIADQQSCSKKAEEIFFKNQEGSISWFKGSEYINHFSKKLNKCFVVIKGGNISVEYMSVLYDVYENKELGNVHTLSNVIVSCGLSIKGKYKECGDFLKENRGMFGITEFNNLTKFYMED